SRCSSTSCWRPACWTPRRSSASTTRRRRRPRRRWKRRCASRSRPRRTWRYILTPIARSMQCTPAITRDYLHKPKFQIPNSKEIQKPKPKIQNGRGVNFGDLIFGSWISLGFGIWDLGFAWRVMATLVQAVRMALHYAEEHLGVTDIFGEDVGPPLGGVFT